SATTSSGAGGQAANVAAWVVDLGASGRCVAKRGEDTAGRLISAELESLGVELAGPTGGRTGVVVSLVGPDGDRTMASGRGAAASATVTVPSLELVALGGCCFKIWLHGVAQ